MARPGQDSFESTHCTTSLRSAEIVPFRSMLGRLPVDEQQIGQRMGFQGSSIPYLSLPNQVIRLSSERDGGVHERPMGETSNGSTKSDENAISGTSPAGKNTTSV